MGKIILGVLALAAPAAADELVLRSGASFTGVVKEENGRVSVEMDIGTMTFERAEVRMIVRSRDPMTELDGMLKVPGDAKLFYALALWARERGLANRSNDLFRKVIDHDPDHEGARKALGYEKVGGQWLAGDELMAAKGFVRVDGRWIPQAEYLQLLQAERQAELERERLEFARQVESHRYALERERLELERERCERIGAPPTGPPVVRFWWERPPDPCPPPPCHKPPPPCVTPPPGPGSHPPPRPAPLRR